MADSNRRQDKSHVGENQELVRVNVGLGEGKVRELNRAKRGNRIFLKSYGGVMWPHVTNHGKKTCVHC